MPTLVWLAVVATLAPFVAAQFSRPYMAALWRGLPLRTWDGATTWFFWQTFFETLTGAWPLSFWKLLYFASIAVAGRLVFSVVVAATLTPYVDKRRRATAIERVVVTFVHGTFASNAPWTRADSQLAQTLVPSSSDDRSLYALEWSGENCHLARSRAAKALREHLLAVEARSPDVAQFVIAHSHGGNVALYALKEGIPSSFEGVVTLSTPFIHARPRPNITDVEALKDRSWMAAAAAFSLAIAAAIYFTVDTLLSPAIAPPGSPIASWLNARNVSILTTSAIVWGLLFGGLFIWCRRATKSLAATLEVRLPATHQMLIVRTPGDEALAALAFLPFASALAQLLGRAMLTVTLTPTRVYALLRRTIDASKGRKLRWWSLYLGAWIGASAMIYLFASWVNDDPLFDGDFPYFLLGIAIISVIAFWGANLFALLLKWAFTVLGTIVSALLQAVAAVAVFPFGPDLMPVVLLRDVTAETAPTEYWEVITVPAGARATPTSAEPDPLMHSRAYSDPTVCSLVRKWVNFHLASPIDIRVRERSFKTELSLAEFSAHTTELALPVLAATSAQSVTPQQSSA